MTTRVIVLTPFFKPVLGGVESNAERLARYFASVGMDVTVLTKRMTADLPDTETFDGVRVSRIGPLGPRSPAAKWRMLPYVVAWLLRRRAEYDVVCSVDCRGVGLGALGARAFTGRPVIAQPQTTGVLVPDRAVGLAARTIKRLLGRLYARADAVACIARTIEREALEAGVPPARVHFLPNAIDMTAFHPASIEERAAARHRFGVGSADLVCVFVGRLSREKGVMDLLEAWRLLRRDAPLLLLVAGPDMDNHAWNVGPAARAFANQHGLQGSVRFLGPTSDVPSLMHAADIAVQPSHFEALGLSAIEAFACGVPVVASAVGGLLDFVKDGENGLTCPALDAAALAGCLRSLLTDADCRRRLASRARASVETEYDERNVFARFATLARDLSARTA
jgi:D-inositol-3-phosphate glycosyltransferase